MKRITPGIVSDFWIFVNVICWLRTVLVSTESDSARVGNLLISSSLICSFFSDQMSNCEWFTQITQDKWATVSYSLRSLITKEQPCAIVHIAHDKWAHERIACFLANRSFALLLTKNEQFAQKNWQKLYFLHIFCTFFSFKKTSDSLIPSFLMIDLSKLLRSLTKNKRCERIAQVAHQKWANSLVFEQIARFLSESHIRSFFSKN